MYVQSIPNAKYWRRVENSCFTANGIFMYIMRCVTYVSGDSAMLITYHHDASTYIIHLHDQFVMFATAVDPLLCFAPSSGNI